MEPKKTFDFDKAIQRVPRWMALLGIAGTGAAANWGGLPMAGPFAVGAAASYLNFRLIEKFTLGLQSGTGQAPQKRGGYILFVQFLLFAFGAFVILRASGFSVGAAFAGFFVCPAAAVAELLYELLTYGHS